MNGWVRLGLLLALLLPAAGCDQATKGLARTHLAFRAPVLTLGGGVMLTYTENPGVAFSMGASIADPYRTHLLRFGVGAVLLFILGMAMTRRTLSRAEVLAYGLVLGGGVGNLIDRFANEGRVVDFVVVTLGPLRSIVFNGADVLIFAGAALLLYAHVRNARAQPARA